MMLFLASEWNDKHEHEASRNHVLTFASDREEAKRVAKSYLGGDPDNYIVSPLANLSGHIEFLL